MFLKEDDKMNQDLLNMELLYSEKDEDVYKALTLKQNWINGMFFVKGNIDTSLDSKGRIHYPFIEALIDDVLLFSSIKVDDKKRESIWNEKYRVLELSYGLEKDAPFAVIYDFNKLDRLGYNSLMPNFYRTIGEDCFDKGSEDITDLIRLLMQKENGKAFLLVEKENLINDVFYAPIMVKIIAFPGASDELKEELQNIAKEKDILYEEVLDNE